MTARRGGAPGNAQAHPVLALAVGRGQLEVLEAVVGRATLDQGGAEVLLGRGLARATGASRLSRASNAAIGARMRIPLKERPRRA